MTKSSPNKVYSNAAERSAKALSKQRKRKSTDKVKANRRQSKYARQDNSAAARKAYSRHDGGIAPDEVIEDISLESLEELKSSFYRTKVVVTREEAQKIEEQTRDQADNEEWEYERRKRLTASNVGGIAKMKNSTKRGNKVKNLLCNTFRGNAATRYGADMEDTARTEYVTYRRRNGHPDLEVDQCGLFISEHNSWLAATSPAVEGFYAGIKQILVSLEAEIFADQHIQNPLKSASGKSC